MAITIGTSPTLVTASFGASTVATGSFSPPVGSLLVAAVATVNGEVTGLSGGSLTWTRRVQSISTFYVEMWTAPAPSGGSGITASAGLDGITAAALKVWVLTGQHASPIGTTGTGATTTNNAAVNAYTSTGSASRGFIVAVDGGTGGTPSSTDDEEAFGTSFFGLAATKAANSGASGSTIQFNLDASGTGAADWEWAALEILAAPDIPRPARSVTLNQAVHRSTLI